MKEREPSAEGPPPEPPVVNTIRRFLLFILILGMGGLLAELCLLKHTEGFWQPVPIVLLGVGVLAVGGWCFRPGPASLRIVRSVMVLFVAAGGVGVYLHYSGNAEFELEMVPGLEGSELVWESLTGATPVLAPAALVQLGLIGLAYGFRHPRREKYPTSAAPAQSSG